VDVYNNADKPGTRQAGAYSAGGAVSHNP